MMFPMKLLSIGVLVANVIAPVVVVDAFTGVVKQRTWTHTTQARQPSQQPSSSLLSPSSSRLSYLMREVGDDVGTCTGTTSIIPTMYTTARSTRRSTVTVAPIASPTGTIVAPTPSPVRDPDPTTGTINLNNFVEEKMIEDLQNQHEQLQMMQMQMKQLQQSVQQSSSYSVTSSSDSSVGIDNTYHDDDLTELNRRLLRSKVEFIRRLLPLNKKQYMERFVNLMIKLSTSSSTPAIATTTTTTLNGNDHRNMVPSRGGADTYDKLYDDLTYLNIQLLRSKVAFLHRLFPQNKKHYMERFVNFMIQFML